MSQKVVLAAAAAALLVASTDARQIISGVPTPSWLSEECAPMVTKPLLIPTNDCHYNKNCIVAYNTANLQLLEEGGNWEFTGGANGGPGGTNWNVGVKIGGTFDEDDETQGLKFVSKVANAANLLIKANQVGLLEEDAELDQVQKLKLGKIVGGALKVVKVAGAVGLLEDEQAASFDLGFSHNGNSWKDFEIAIGKAHEMLDQYQKIKDSGLFDDETTQKINWGKVAGGVGKALDLAGKAKQIGLFDEEEEEGCNGRLGCTENGQLPPHMIWYNYALENGLLDEDQDIQKLKIKLSQVLGGVDKALDLAGKAKSIGLFDQEEIVAPNDGKVYPPWIRFDEDEEAQKINWGKVAGGVGKALDLAGKAKQIGLFDEEQLWQPGPFRPTPTFPERRFEQFRFDEDEEAQKINWGKVAGGVGKALDLAGKAKQIGLFDEEQLWQPTSGPFRPTPTFPERRFEQFEELWQPTSGPFRPTPTFPVPRFEQFEELSPDFLRPIIRPPIPITPVLMEEDDVVADKRQQKKLHQHPQQSQRPQQPQQRPSLFRRKVQKE